MQATRAFRMQGGYGNCAHLAHCLRACVQALLEANKKKLGAKGGKLEASGLDKRTLVAEVLTERMKEAQEMERRMHKLAKQLDHLERARREEEAPLLNQLSATRLEEARKQHGEQQTLDLARHRSQWESDLEDKKRLSVTLGDTEAFKAQIMARREEEFEELSRLREEAYKQVREGVAVEGRGWGPMVWAKGLRSRAGPCGVCRGIAMFF